VQGLNGTDQPVFIANGTHKPLLQHRSIKLCAALPHEKSSTGDHAATELVRSAAQANGHAFEVREYRSANGNNGSPERWLRAVEKFRSYEADLNRRVGQSKKSKAITAGPLRTSGTGRPGLPQRAVLHPDRFDELWDGLIPDRQQGVELSIPATSLAPLPRSLSLVVVEAREATRDRRGDKHASKKVLEKLYNSLQRMLQSR
jgi:hypothetical protein